MSEVFGLRAALRLAACPGMLTRRILQLVVTLGLFAFVYCQQIPAQKNSHPITEFLQQSRPDFNHARSLAVAPRSGEDAFVVVSLKSGRLVLAHNPRLPLMPASSVKILTTIAALEILGPEHRFETRLAYDGSIADGTLQGNLYLIGGGDPELEAADLDEMIRHLHTAGIRQISGQLIADGSLFASFQEVSDLMADDAYYNTAPGALNVNMGMQYLHWRTDDYSSFSGRDPRQYYPASRAQVEKERLQNLRILPDLDYNRIESSSRLAASHDKADLEYRPAEKSKDVPYLQGTWRLHPDFFKQSENRWRNSTLLPVKNPALFSGLVFQKMAAIQGIRIPAVAVGQTPRLGISTIATVQSPALRRIVRENLHYSSNLIAETLLLHIARALGKTEARTLAAAGTVLGDWWQAKLPAVDWSGFVMAGGSGLDPAQRITALQMAAVLVYARETMPWFSSLLPLNGVPGVFQGKLWHPADAMHVQAKPGAIFYAVSLAGYYWSDQGEPFVFVSLINDLQKRAFLDGKDAAQALRYEKAAPGWNGIHRRIIDHRLSFWLRGKFERSEQTK
ncbi:MAG: D-alanyl-D-alanine carboxypeptidase [Leptospiraceae bacterium]|nr:D-alanyl-D-alanine carboxypeptidase [Leptospiraceae bacterium]